MGKVLYRLKDIEAYEEACLIRKVLGRTQGGPERNVNCSNDLESVRNSLGGEGEIRTHDPREGTPVFKTGAFNRSATSPFGVRTLQFSNV